MAQKRKSPAPLWERGPGGRGGAYRPWADSDASGRIGRRPIACARRKTSLEVPCRGFETRGWGKPRLPSAVLVHEVESGLFAVAGGLKDEVAAVGGP